MTRITMKDVRAAGVCAKGGLKFARRHKLDVRKLCREGLPAEDFAATGDAMALHVIEVARARR